MRKKHRARAKCHNAKKKERRHSIVLKRVMMNPGSLGGPREEMNVVPFAPFVLSFPGDRRRWLWRQLKLVSTASSLFTSLSL